MDSPIFVFSLPRSGSTLLQRILSGHDQISTVSEPWLLLPLEFMNKKTGTLSVYSHVTSQKAISDLISKLPNGEEDFNLLKKNFISSVYEKLCMNNEKYFLDKTPRYYLIIDEIFKLFPDAKFIFLFRNPVQIFSSIVSTWGNGRLYKMYGYESDVIDGFELLSKGYEKYKGKSIAVNYENLVNDNTTVINEITNYLGVGQMVKNNMNEGVPSLKGRMGDPTGTQEYKSVSSNSLNKWKETIRKSFIRKYYIKKCLKQINSSSLSTQGYSMSTIISDINSLKCKISFWIIKDFLDLLYSKLVLKLKLNLFSKNIYLWFKKGYIS